MLCFDAIDNEAADTQRFQRFDPDATSIYDLRGTPLYVGRSDRAATRHLIRTSRQDVARLREALVAGWAIGPELAYEEQQLAVLEAALRQA